MTNQAEIDQAVARLDAWLDTMRTRHGYGGPVAHWWHNCLCFVGPGLDWRYEGIILGYLNLYERTREDRWLAKARRAGDDLLLGQLPTGNYRNSSFELNPYTCGTPHEAACDLALIHLAGTLKRSGEGDWEQYLLVAKRNLMAYHLGRLWSEEIQDLGNGADNPTFTPNKSATIIEALFAMAELQGDEEVIERYALPTLRSILLHQVSVPGHHLDGAIDQNSQAGRRWHRYFPFYNARCIPALLKGYEHTRDERYRDAAWRTMSFLLHTRLSDGSFPQVVYGNGRVYEYPKWIAGAGEILRAMQLVSISGMATSEDDTLRWMLLGQDESGGIRTASGFSAQATQRRRDPRPEFRDLLTVCGWADKAFRYLTSRIQDGALLPEVAAGTTELACTFKGQDAEYREDSVVVEVSIDGRSAYRYYKGAAWADVPPMNSHPTTPDLAATPRTRPLPFKGLQWYNR